MSWQCWEEGHHLNGLVQERRNSSALAMEFSFSRINLSTCHWADLTLSSSSDFAWVIYGLLPVVWIIYWPGVEQSWWSHEKYPDKKDLQINLEKTSLSSDWSQWVCAAKPTVFHSGALAKNSVQHGESVARWIFQKSCLKTDSIPSCKVTKFFIQDGHHHR